MYANIDDFIEELKKSKHEYLPQSEIETIYKRIDKVSIRIIITPSIFIDVYANTANDRYDFSLIKPKLSDFKFTTKKNVKIA